jgi:hypothetical protein
MLFLGARVTLRRRVKLGAWTTPNGNNVIVYYRSSKTGLARLEFRWDSPPPLSPDDAYYYRAVIRPGAVELVREYTERVGVAMVVEL